MVIKQNKQRWRSIGMSYENTCEIGHLMGTPGRRAVTATALRPGVLGGNRTCIISSIRLDLNSSCRIIIKCRNDVFVTSFQHFIIFNGENSQK